MNLVEAVLRFGPGRPKPETHPELDDKAADELEAAANKLTRAAVAARAMAAQKRALVAFGYGLDAWRLPPPERHSEEQDK